MPDPIDDEIARTVRQALVDGQPEHALETLSSASIDDRPDLLWLRVLAVARTSHALAVHVALRALLRDHPLPPTALVDVAPPFADAVLAGDPERIAAWRPLATALHHATQAPSTGPQAGGADAVLAWVLLAHANPEGDPHPADVVRLSALARRLGRQDDAIALARSAQKHARHQDDPEAFATATSLLAALVRAEDDPGLAEKVLAHGVRELRSFRPEHAEDFLATARTLVARWAAPGDAPPDGTMSESDASGS